MCRGNFALRIVAVRPHSRCFSRLTPCKYVTVIQELEPSRFYRLSFHPFRDNLGPPCSGLGFVEYYVALGGADLLPRVSFARLWLRLRFKVRAAA